jgi:crossover junction endodeoxyribonuclease RuvC
MTLIAGIDPGLEGAICVYDGYRRLEIVDMPTLTASKTGKRDIDPHALADLLRSTLRPHHAFLERVGAMPGQGVSSMFNFGKGYGIVVGVLAALQISFTAVRPDIWKRVTGTATAKDASRVRASQVFPASTALWPLKKHHGRADAALLAYYGYRKLFPDDARHGTVGERQAARDLYSP